MDKQTVLKRLALPAFLTSLLVLIIASLALIISFWPSHVTLKTPNQTYYLAVAKTNEALSRGLGDRSSLAADQGMLFSFGSSSKWCMWMKGMHFPLDMIWLSPEKQVVAIKEDVLPSTFPETFCPGRSAQYVIELNSGSAQKAGIRLNQTLQF